MSPGQNVIAALDVAVILNQYCLTCRLEYSSDQMFRALVWNLVVHGRQAKISIYEESRKTLNLYTSGWQSYLNTLIQAFADIATPAAAVQSASGVPSTLVPEAHKAAIFMVTMGSFFNSVLSLCHLKFVQNQISFTDVFPFGDICWKAEFDWLCVLGLAYDIISDLARDR